MSADSQSCLEGLARLRTMGGYAGLNQEVYHQLSQERRLGLFGAKGFFLTGDAYDVAVFALFLFQMVFMDTTATIPTGAMAERWKYSSFVIYGLFVGSIIYPLYGNWVWGGGWLATLGTNFGLGHGHVDFAGSSVVHLTGGVLALVGAKMIGPRIGKYKKDGTRGSDPGTQHSDGDDRNVHPGFRMVRIQSWINAGWRGPPHFGCRGQHDACRIHRRICCDVLDVAGSRRKAGSQHDVQRYARGPRRNHSALRIR